MTEESSSSGSDAFGAAPLPVDAPQSTPGHSTSEQSTFGQQTFGQQTFGHPAPEPGRPPRRWPAGLLTRQALTEAALIVGLFAVVGAGAGWVWKLISPARPRAYVVRPDAFIPQETEGFISTDARFAIITAAIGAVLALLIWRRRAIRGPVTVAALGLGGVAGSLICAAVGRWIGGGSASGAPDTVIVSLLQVHATTLLGLQAFVAVAFYASAVLLCEDDDLRFTGIPSAPQPGNYGEWPATAP